MPVTLERLIKSMESIAVKTESKFADRWLGVFKGVIPEEMTSTEYVGTLRESCYGKV